MKNLEQKYVNEAILNQLKETYKKTMITKKELAHQLSVSVSSINGCIVRCEGIPDYVKLGKSRNSKVLFPIVNVAAYLSNTVKVA